MQSKLSVVTQLLFNVFLDTLLKKLELMSMTPSA